MGVSLLSQPLAFNGSMSVQAQFSPSADFNTLARVQQAGFLFDFACTVSGPFGITLQVNADPSGVILYGFRDVTDATIQVLDTTACSYLTQTNGSIGSGKRRGGVINATGNFFLLLQFVPLRATYRLIFEPVAPVIGTINNIIAMS